MTASSASQIDTKVLKSTAAPAQTGLPWTTPRLERLQGGDTQDPKNGGDKNMARSSAFVDES